LGAANGHYSRTAAAIVPTNLENLNFAIEHGNRGNKVVGLSLKKKTLPVMRWPRVCWWWSSIENKVMKVTTFPNK
jgi:hypothetical protein